MTSNFYPGIKVTVKKEYDILVAGQELTVKEVKVYKDGTYGFTVEDQEFEYWYWLSSPRCKFEIQVS